MASVFGFPPNSLVEPLTPPVVVPGGNRVREVLGTEHQDGIRALTEEEGTAELLCSVRRRPWGGHGQALTRHDTACTSFLGS